MRVLFLFICCLFGVGILFVPTRASALEFRVGYTGGNCERCAWIAADGEITPNSVEELAAFMSDNQVEYLRLIVLNSPGGNVAGGLSLGEFIRERGMRVMVGRTYDVEPEGAGRLFQSFDEGVCASACVLAFMGGVERELGHEKSLIGVHQFAVAEDHQVERAATMSSTQSTVALLQSYAIGMGVDPLVITLASAIGADQMLWLDGPDMERMNLLTSRMFGEMEEWSLRPLGDVLAAVVTQPQASGRSVTFAAACQYLYAVVVLPYASRIEAVAEGIRGAHLAIRNSAVLPLSFRGITAEHDQITLEFWAGSRLHDMIAQGGDRLRLVIDIPMVYASELGGRQFEIPTTNFVELSPHVRRSC